MEHLINLWELYYDHRSKLDLELIYHPLKFLLENLISKDHNSLLVSI